MSELLNAIACDTCPEPATFRAEETACQRDHCGECIGRCSACQSEIAGELATERALDEWRANR